MWHELNFDCPESLLDWILLYLSAIPTWLIPIFAQAREKSCSRVAVRNSLHHVFGPDVKPHLRDVQRVIQEGKHSNVDNVNRTSDFPDEEFLDPLDFDGFPHTHSIPSSSVNEKRFSLE